MSHKEKFKRFSAAEEAAMTAQYNAHVTICDAAFLEGQQHSSHMQPPTKQLERQLREISLS